MLQMRHCCRILTLVVDRPQVFQTMMDQWYLWKILLITKYGHPFCSHVARYISLEEQKN